MATDYISRDSIIKWIDDSLEQCGSRYTAEQENMMEMFRTVVNDCLPFADVEERKHGKWKIGIHGVVSDATVKWYDQFITGAFIYCSNCKERSNKKSNFCSNCGARMDGE